jgi:transposase
VQKFSSEIPMQTIGLDLGDRRSVYCVLNRSGEIVRRGTVATTQIGMSELFGGMAPSRVVLEVGTHSPWVSRLIASCGHEVVVANARKVKAISGAARLGVTPWAFSFRTFGAWAAVFPRRMPPHPLSGGTP